MAWICAFLRESLVFVVVIWFVVEAKVLFFGYVESKEVRFLVIITLERELFPVFGFI